MKTFFPILLAITGGVLYHVAQKSVPHAVSPYAAIIIAYAVGSALCFAALGLDASQPSFTASLKELNWAVVALGLGAVVIEVGFLLAYRTGWNISTASVVTNISVALILLPVGLLAFREQLTWRSAAGLTCCLLDLYLLAQK